MKILIIGGYGNVGGKIVSILHSWDTYFITITGRDTKKAKTFVSAFDGALEFVAFDVNHFHKHSELILNQDIILSCIDFYDSEFAGFVLQNGKIYIDITANYSCIKIIEGMHEIARKNNGLAILSVGLAPGLSNLMLKHLVQDTAKIEKAEIFLQLGLGEKNGKAAVKWIIDNINPDYFLVQGNNTISITPFTKSRKETIFKKKILFYPFNFSDQHVLHHTLNIPSVMSLLGFDNNFASILLSLLKRTGFFNLLKYKPVYSFVQFLFSNIHFGSTIFRLKVKVFNSNGHVLALSIKGNEEAKLTARVACEVIQWISLNKNRLPVGIKHIEQLLAYAAIIDNLDLLEREVNTII